MYSKIHLTLGILLYALAVPFLELNDTHLFNPEWVAHARLHEAWQLITNSAIGAYAAWLIWARDDVRLPSLLALMVTGGFMIAYVLQDLYGGSMLYSDGTERTLLGVNIGVIGFGYVILSASACLIRAPANARHTS